MKIKNSNLLIFLGLVIILIGLLPTNSIPEANNSNQTTNSLDIQDGIWYDTELITVESTLLSDSVTVMEGTDNNLYMVYADGTDILGSGTDKDIFLRIYERSEQAWLEPILISTESTDSSRDPVAALDSQNNIHIVWFEVSTLYSSGADSDLFYIQYTAQGELIEGMELSDFGAGTSEGPSIAVDHNDNVFIVYHESDDGGTGIDWDIRLRTRLADGQWMSSILISGISSSDSLFPDLAIDSENRIHIVWEDLYPKDGADGLSDIFYTIYNPDDQVVSTVNVLSNNNTASNAVSAGIAINDHDQVFVTYSHAEDIEGAGPDEDIFYKMFNHRSIDYGPPNLLSTDFDDTVMTGLDIDSRGNFHAIMKAYIGPTPGFTQLYTVKVSTDGEIIGDKEQITNFAADVAKGSILIDNQDIRYYIIELGTDIMSSGNDQDIFISKFVPNPEVPIISIDTIAPSNGEIGFSWKYSYGAGYYEIYHSSSPIYDYSSLNPILTTSSNYYYETNLTAGSNYYLVVAANDYLKSSSDIIGINVDSSGEVGVEIITETSIVTEPQNVTITETINGDGSNSTEEGLSFNMITSILGIFVISTLVLRFRSRK